ncbi:sucrase ferredoxin [Streptomyces avicenniae]|uniref:sucrase ferredoxin n=1 Tax=Streptomyces avicenniae TaxID=500153 RepID=UPI00069BF329|nr:sucrase ferredoxin [Streptomyces avicenniae]
MSTCTTLSREREEPLAGTAATARTWLLVEQPGPWGPKALTGSRLDPGVGAALEAAAVGTGVRVALIRRPGRQDSPAGHASSNGDAATPPTRRVLLAHTLPGRAWVRTLSVSDPRALLDLDLTALGAGRHDATGAAYDGAPLTLVCTNGRRDRCCALLGRPLAAELLSAGGSDVWEISHIGGHRFSPTLLVLPHGYAYGRMDAVAVKEVVTALHEGRVTTDRCRGRSAWDRPGQAAELAVRSLTGETHADALTVAPTADVPGTRHGRTVLVTHRDGRRWSVSLSDAPAGPPAPASCGAAPTPQPRPAVRRVTALPR